MEVEEGEDEEDKDEEDEDEDIKAGRFNFISAFQRLNVGQHTWYIGV